MEKNDLFWLCILNVRRHGFRAMLTILGVVVGCCSIVIMISLGIGMREAQERMLAEMGDLTLITVSSAGKGSRAKKLTKQSVESIKRLSGVKEAAPKAMLASVPVRVYAGDNRRFISDEITVAGISEEALVELGYEVIAGALQNGQEGTAAAGQYFAYSFRDTARPEGSNMVDFYGSYSEDGTPGEAPEPYVDVLDTEFEIEFGAEEDGKKTIEKLKVGAVLKEDYGKGDETFQGLLLPLHEFQRFMETYAQKTGTIYQRDQFQTIMVKTNGIDDVAKVEKAITKMGFRCNSMEAIRKPMEKEAKQKQMMLAGLGTVSLFVAALGIMNTMMMSITERTKEIGIMKSLGCFVDDIRLLFLLEAGCIGFLGGAAGAVISVAISIIMNLISAKADISMLPLLLHGELPRISVVPPWLLAFAILFSIAIGIASGYYPAAKAVKIPALEAIKSE